MKEATPKQEQRLLLSFTSLQWSGRPAKDAIYSCLGLGVIGFFVCLVLMIFIAGLRDPGAGSLFIAVFAVGLTALAVWAKVSSEKKFLTRIHQRVNETILELTGNPNDRLSLPDFRKFIENERRIPLLVHGVPGLELRAVRHGESPAIGPKQPPPHRTAPRTSSTARTPVVTTTQVVIAITPPDYGTASFDRLLQATLDAD
jgi:hypothetical protein